jgi:hypothetical protein
MNDLKNKNYLSGFKDHFRIGAFISLILLNGCAVNARNLTFPIKNFFNEPENEIKFGRVAPIFFKFSTSSCKSTNLCGHNLFDSNKNTEWVTEKNIEPEWITIDFLSKRLVNRIEWEISPQSNPIKEIQIQVLHRNEWLTIHKINQPEKTGSTNFGSIDASVLRIYFPKKNTEQFALKNLKVFLNDSLLTGISNRFTGYTLPVPNAVLPSDDYSLPGAPRKYRNGIHKGLDLFLVKNKEGKDVPMTKDTIAVAIADGEIVRYDSDYQPMTEAEYNEITEYNKTNPVTYVNRDFGGRQIWIDHKNGVMSSYNHLSSLSPTLKLGSKVKKGEKIGNIGNSGLLPEAKGTQEKIHLHLEIWIDGEFLGNDMSLSEMKKFLQYFFTE